MDYETGAVVLVALAAFRIIEFMLNKFIGSDVVKQDRDNHIKHEERLEEVGGQIDALFNWHKPASDGVQSWKVPADFGVLLREIRDGIRDLLTEVRRQNGKTP